MCGILGYIGPRNFSIGQFREVLDGLTHRGPDDEGIYEEPEVLLGHRRLSILDLSEAGHQPMVSASGRHVIVYNGEIYNFSQLRDYLERGGAQLRSASDTEVILEAYEREGPACLRRFRGMFAIAIWDKFEKRLFLARDRMGVKPLYVWRHSNGIAFASAVKALRRLPGGPSEINPEAVAQYLYWGSVPEPLTMLMGVKPLRPATWMTWAEHKCHSVTYWDIPLGPHENRTRAQAVEALRPVLREAVRLRCVADVQVGAFLSGGIDSSAVVSLMRDAGQEGLNTFSISFPGTPYDESHYARAVAEQIGTNHHDLPVTADMVFEALDEFFDVMDQPTCDGLNTYLVSKFAAQAGMKVCVSGVGGDELFAGYPSFKRSRWLIPLLRLMSGIPPGLTSSMFGRFSGGWSRLEVLNEQNKRPGHKAYFLSRGLFSPSQVRRLLASDNISSADQKAPSWSANLPTVNPAAFPDPVRENALLELRRYLLNQLLRDSDVFGMGCSLEIRVPLIDHLVVESASALASGDLIRSPVKSVLLDCLPGRLPRDCTHRPKQGFTFPLDTWMRGPWRAAMAEALNAAGWVLRPGKCTDLWSEFSRGRTHWSRPWSVIVLARHLSTLSNGAA